MSGSALSYLGTADSAVCAMGRFQKLTSVLICPHYALTKCLHLRTAKHLPFCPRRRQSARLCGDDERKVFTSRLCRSEQRVISTES